MLSACQRSACNQYGHPGPMQFIHPAKVCHAIIKLIQIHAVTSLCMQQNHDHMTIVIYFFLRDEFAVLALSAA